ncbi:MAG: sigma 54-interacting transcriptional regulator [Planctomycetes bacterium]|nr:sigma 54-interacting transcriptional regulator [Planctomycetota bacterium]
MPKASTQLIGSSPAFRKALDDASVAARQVAPVLVIGETGSGKGVIAEYVHRKSARGGRLVSLNCATFQSNLFESELFGYMRGAFTGAAKDTPGLFEAAEGGTLFLDEIGDTPLEIQPKLLRALEEGVIRRVGGTREIPVNVRLVCATNHDLKALIAAGKFREDLYYRINSFVVTLPPLRERREDIAELARYFLDEHGSAAAGLAKDLAVETCKALESYAWPGNIRELRSAMSYAAAQAGERHTIQLEDLPDAIRGTPTAEAPPDAGASYLEAFRELYRTGAENPQLWADFLLRFNDHLGSNKFARHDVLVCLRAVRGEEPTNNALVNEWQRHIKPIPLRLGLIHEEGKKLRIDLEACERSHRAPPEQDVPDEPEPDTEQMPPLAERNRHTNLDSPRTTFIGRQEESRQLCAMIRSGRPNLITITGPGGTGKTRLSREVGRLLVRELPGGVWFADLTESRNIEGVAYAVAQALGVPLTGNQSPELAVGAILRSRAPSLLILDNFEQVAEVASPTIAEWVRHAPQLVFLVTSRALLGVEGEQEFELQSLPLPKENAPPDLIAKSEAVRLFVERARVHHVGFSLNPSSAPAVARICQRLEGMPLAIELAAARTVIMQPEQIAERLDKLFDVLKSSRRDLQPRQRSLHATLDWSYDLLNDVERWAFAQLSVFRGGFFLEAAEEILDLSRYPDAPSPMDVIQSLREKSLLRALETPYETRFNMYQLIREYAAEHWEKLANDAEREAVAARFGKYYRRYGTEWTRRAYTQDALEALDRLDYARANLRAAADWAFDHRHDPECLTTLLELSNELGHLYRVRGPGNARVPALRRALEVAGDTDSPQHVKLLCNLSQAEQEAGDPAQSSGLAKSAVEMAERLGDEMLLATARFQMAGVEYAAGNIESAQHLHQQALPVFEKLGNEHNAGRVLARMALACGMMGNFDEALQYSMRAEEVLRHSGDLSGLAFVHSIRGSIYLKRGNNELALEQIVASERIYRDLTDKRMITLSLGNRSLVCRRLRRFDEAIRYAVECDELTRELGDRQTMLTNQMNTGLMFVELEDFDQAEAWLKECRDEARRQHSTRTESVCVESLGVIACRRGDYAAARKLLDDAAKLAGEDDEQRAGVGVSRAELLLAESDPTAALAAIQPALDYWRSKKAREGRDWFRTLTVVARANAEMDSKQAREAADDALELAAKLHFNADDASPFIRESLEILKKL